VERATSFGTIALDYDRYRPAPPPAVADWLLPGDATRVADVCAGTGGFSRVLAGRVDEVVAVDLDLRMVSLASAIPGVAAVSARGEALPVPASSLDAVTVSSGWHWLDHDLAVPEIARALRPGGVLGVVWGGASRRVEWVRELLGRRRSSHHEGGHVRELRIPDGQPFSQPESRDIEWTISRTPSELIGLVATYSRFIALGPRERRNVVRRAVTVLENHPLLRGRARIELPMTSQCWRAVRLEEP
jgi:SAM-dependent methyltransferase